MLILENRAVSTLSDDVLKQLSETESQRSQSRKQWLQLISQVVETGATDIETLYQTVFASLCQVSLFLT